MSTWPLLVVAMDDKEMVDVATLDPELLQLQEVSSFAMKASPQLADELFSQWLSLPDTGRLVCIFLLPFSSSFRYCFLMHSVGCGEN